MTCGEFKIYNDLCEKLQEKIKDEDYKIDKMILYYKFRHPLTRDHSEIIGKIILHHMKLKYPKDFENLISIKNNPEKRKIKNKKIDGQYQNMIFENQRVSCGRTLGECHHFGSFDETLLGILDIYHDYYKEILTK